MSCITERVQPGGTLAGLANKFIINMDETPVYFEPTTTTTINKRGAKTVSVRASGSSYRCTAVLAVAADGTKLAPMVIFKAVPGATIEKNLASILPEGCAGTGLEVCIYGWKGVEASHPWRPSIISSVG